jgi:hypothetical protein
MPPIIEWADITGAASIATTTAHPIVILRSITILPTVTKRVITTLLHFGCVAVIQICSATTPPRNSVIRKKQKGSNY